MRISLGGGVRAGNELSESLSGEFRASHGLSRIIFALLEFAEDVHPVRGGLETLGDRSNSESSEIRRRNASLAIPRVVFLQEGSNPRRKNAHRSGVIATFVQDSDGGEVLNGDFRVLVSVSGHCIGLGLGHGGDILCGLDHTEGGTK